MTFVITDSAVDKHTKSILSTLELLAAGALRRRILVVLRVLGAARAAWALPQPLCVGDAQTSGTSPRCTGRDVAVTAVGCADAAYEGPATTTTCPDPWLAWFTVTFQRASSAPESTPLENGVGSRREIALTHFAGRAGDHNNRAMAGARHLASVLAERLQAIPTVVSAPEPALSVDWRTELDVARPGLREMTARLDGVFDAQRTPITAMNRCAVGLATLPVVLRHRPDAVVVWFDAHADLNTPATTASGYLGGLALSGPLGLWDSGFGSGLRADRTILVGARDLDPPERALLMDGAVAAVGGGADMVSELRAAVARRPVYIHIDCDVLEPGIVPTDYVVPDGLTLTDLHAAASSLAESEIVGLEVGELESEAGLTVSPAYVRDLVSALDPLLRAMAPDL